MVKRTIFLAAVMLIAALLAVSCVPQSPKEEKDEHAYVWFGFLEAKDGVNTEVYTSDTSSGTVTEATVEARAAKDLYWSYKATKNANSEGFAYGNTGGNFANVATGAGLGTNFEFSKGTWDFELVAYTTADDRTNQEHSVYKGSVTEYEIKSNGQITIPVDYAYSDGKGTATFVIKASVTQDALGDNLASAIGTYSVTGVKAYIGSMSTNLSLDSTSGNWKGTINEVPYGLQKTKFEVYVANESTARVTTEECNAVILSNMQTTISGTASVHLNKNTATMTFVIDATEEQPKLYEITYNLNDGQFAAGAVVPESCYVGQVVTPPEPTKESTTTTTTPETTYWTAGSERTDYTFKGWKVSNTDDSTASKSYTAAANNVKLVAVWSTTTTSTRTCKLSVGSTITLGTYPTTYTNSSGTSTSAGDYDGKPVTWKVLSVDETNNKALVISEKILTYMKPYTAAQYSDSSAATYYKKYTYRWTDCDINSYLNDSFIAEYGLKGVSMASVEHETEAYTFTDNSSEGTSTTATKSSEKVFLLSVAEVNKYFTTYDARVAYPLSDTTSAAYWRLRSPSSFRCYCVAVVGDLGYVDSLGYYVFSQVGLRPAFWINLP